MNCTFNPATVPPAACAGPGVFFVEHGGCKVEGELLADGRIGIASDGTYVCEGDKALEDFRLEAQRMPDLCADRAVRAPPQGPAMARC